MHSWVSCSHTVRQSSIEFVVSYTLPHPFIRYLGMHTGRQTGLRALLYTLTQFWDSCIYTIHASINWNFLVHTLLQSYIAIYMHKCIYSVLGFIHGLSHSVLLAPCNFIYSHWALSRHSEMQPILAIIIMPLMNRRSGTLRSLPSYLETITHWVCMHTLIHF